MNYSQDETQERTYRTYIIQKETDEKLYYSVDADQGNMLHKFYRELLMHNLIKPSIKDVTNLDELEEVLTGADYQVCHTYNSVTKLYNTNIYVFKC
jgi:hypothetical protein